MRTKYTAQPTVTMKSKAGEFSVTIQIPTFDLDTKKIVDPLNSHVVSPNVTGPWKVD